MLYGRFGHQRRRLVGQNRALCSVRMSRLSTVSRLISLWECFGDGLGQLDASAPDRSPQAVTLAPPIEQGKREGTPKTRDRPQERGRDD